MAEVGVDVDFSDTEDLVESAERVIAEAIEQQKITRGVRVGRRTQFVDALVVARVEQYAVVDGGWIQM